MDFHILTLFPEMVESGLNTSIIGRAASQGLISIETIDIRKFTEDKHGHVDDTPYGGGAGMVIMCQPVFDAFSSVKKTIEEKGGGRRYVVLYTSPAGRLFHQDMAKELSSFDDVIILCGHYEGVDQRVLELMDAREVSIGDYVLTGGELPAMVMTDAVCRMVPGVLTNSESAEDESFSDVHPSAEFTKRARKEVYGELAGRESVKLLEYPQYTKPREFMGLEVPEILLSGNHDKIDQYRRAESLKRTKERRPDLLK